jgi:hypothetical protein
MLCRSASDGTTNCQATATVTGTYVPAKPPTRPAFFGLWGGFFRFSRRLQLSRFQSISFRRSHPPATSSLKPALHRHDRRRNEDRHNFGFTYNDAMIDIHNRR